MENYKKKSLEFMGYAREMRYQKRQNERTLSRHNRFSLLRPLQEENTPVSTKKLSKIPSSISSKIPGPDMQKNQAVSRVEMLQKWKQNKMLKKQVESRLKKPAFKVGVVKALPLPTKSSLDNTSCSSSRSRSQISEISGKKSQNSSSANLKISHKDLKSSEMKPRIANNFESKLQNKGLKSSDKPKIASNFGSKLQNKVTFSNKAKVSTVEDKNKSKESHLKPSNFKPNDNAAISKDLKSKVSNTNLPKTNSRIMNKIPGQTLQTNLRKPNASKIPDVKLNQKIPAKSNIGKDIAKSFEIDTSKSKNSITEKPTKNMKEINKNSTKLKQDIHPKPDLKNFSFECELSYIEPVVGKKSFAPEGFMFHPPIELNSSLFLDEGPSSIFARLKSQNERTSTPKQNVVDQLEAQQSYSRYNLFSPENVNNPVTFTLDSEKEDTAKLNDCKPSLTSESTENSTAQKDPVSFTLDSEKQDSAKSNDCKPSLKSESTENSTAQKEKIGLPNIRTLAPSEEASTDKKSFPIVHTNQSAIVKFDSVETEKSEAVSCPFNFSENSVFLNISSTAEKAELPVNVQNSTDFELLENTEGVSDLMNSFLDSKILITNLETSDIVKNLDLQASMKVLNIKDWKRKLQNVLKRKRSSRLKKLPSDLNLMENIDDEKMPIFYNSFEETSPVENLKDVRRPSLFSSLDEDEVVSKKCQRGITYDFDRLSLETEELTQPRSTRSQKVSLLYSPRKSVFRKSIKGDLMSFSPDV
ncbi:uncharacterized protein CDAR_75451 [Caerostris darwini]|uniref:Uncharacterized protein n=1 Tax=Caerostris darwini TaxID=1538125 RepID=A0AAV4XA92_9ARAC|nr:uncharacterized protein CDAR_75451 [Caerostris darwini]